jgi:hypothetical protein
MDTRCDNFKSLGVYWPAGAPYQYTVGKARLPRLIAVLRDLNNTLAEHTTLGKTKAQRLCCFIIFLSVILRPWLVPVL